MSGRGQTKYKVGDRFGSLTLLQFCPGVRPGKWVMQCDCGNISKLFSSNVRGSRSTRCMKCQAKHLSIIKRAKLIGKKYGKLTIIKWDQDRYKWACLCVCGTECFRSTSTLNSVKKNGCESFCGKCHRLTNKIPTPDLSVEESQRLRHKETHENRINKKIHNFKILSYEYRFKGVRNHCFYKCKCKCGNIFEIKSGSLAVYKSCGCIKDNYRKLSNDDLEVIVHLIDNCNYLRKELCLSYNISYSLFCQRVKSFRKETLDEQY